MLKYIFVLFRPISIKAFGADLHKNLFSVYNFVKFGTLKGILQ